MSRYAHPILWNRRRMGDDPWYLFKNKDRYLRELIETRGDDAEIIYAEAHRILWWLRWEIRLRQWYWWSARLRGYARTRIASWRKSWADWKNPPPEPETLAKKLNDEQNEATYKVIASQQASLDNPPDKE